MTQDVRVSMATDKVSIGTQVEEMDLCLMEDVEDDMTNQESHLCQVMPKILMLQVLCRYFSGTFHVTGTFKVLYRYFSCTYLI